MGGQWLSFQEEDRDQQRAGRWESWSAVEGTEAITFKLKCCDADRLNSAGPPILFGNFCTRKNRQKLHSLDGCAPSTVLKTYAPEANLHLDRLLSHSLKPPTFPTPWKQAGIFPFSCAAIFLTQTNPVRFPASVIFKASSTTMFAFWMQQTTERPPICIKTSAFS